MRRLLVRGLWSEIWTWLLALFAEAALESSAAARTPAVDIDRGLLRCGRRVVAISEIDRARIGAMENLDGEYGVRLFNRAIDIFVPIREGSALVLTPETRDLLLAILPQTSIRMPEDPYDPTGKFARHNFPGYFTLEEIIVFITELPEPEESTFWG